MKLKLTAYGESRIGIDLIATRADLEDGQIAITFANAAIVDGMALAFSTEGKLEKHIEGDELWVRRMTLFGTPCELRNFLHEKVDELIVETIKARRASHD